MVLGSAKEVQISTQAMESNSREKKAVLEKELTTVSDKKKCFACKETSHTLDQCRTKEKLVTVAQQFGNSTRFPFYMIQPSEEVAENEKIYHLCLLITSNMSNLDPGRVKTELNKFWKLTDDWEIRREGRQNFIASFNSEDDLTSCLKPPKIKTSVNEKEVKFTVSRWNEGDEKKLDLFREWLLVYGVPRTYRNWKELYQVASAVGVLLEVDEESLKCGDKEPIRLRIALGSLVGAPFSYHFVFGWSSRLVKFMIEDKVNRIEWQRKELEERNGGEHLDSIIMEYEDRREKGFEVPPETRNKGMNSKSTRVSLTGSYMLDFEGCSEKDHKGELKTTETAVLLEEPKLIEELRLDGEIKENNVSALPVATTNSKKATKDIPKAEGAQSTSGSSTRGNHMLDLEGCSDKERIEERKNTETATLLEVPKFIEELRVDGEIKENSLSALVATTNNAEKTTEDIPKAEGGQSISGSSTSIIEGLFRGIQKPPIKNVYVRRRDQKQKGSTEQQAASKKLNKGMNPGSSSHATRIGNSTCNMLDSRSFLEKEHGKELKMSEIALLGKGPKSVDVFGGDRENKDGNARATTIYYTKRQTAVDTLKVEEAQSISRSTACMIGGTQTKGVYLAGTRPEGAQFDGQQHISKMNAHGQQHISKMNAQLTQTSKEFSTYNETYDSFTEMGLRENLLKGIYAYGLEKPSAIHQRGIVPLCKGLDVIQQSLSGTTVTLSCGVLQRLDCGSTECQALVLVPTRDLAQETEKAIGALGHWLGVKVHACFGGTSIRKDQQILSSSVQVIVGTPGRILDMLRRRALCPDHIRMFVLDEADEMLTGGFKDQINDIIQLLPTKIQLGVFSATMSHVALEFCCKFMNKPLTIIVPRDEELEGISMKQFYVKVEKEELKLDKLCDLFDTMAVTQSIIFVNTRRKAKSLMEKVRGKEYTVSASHGGMDQQARDDAIQELRSGSSRVLIATDLRGTDALQVPVVINYDLPTQPVHYLRRVRRSGQSGGKGVAISFVTRVDERVLSDIQRFCNTQLMELPSSSLTSCEHFHGYGVQMVS